MPRAHLLLVDGDSKSLQLLEVSLRKVGFQVTTSREGNDALGKASLLTPDLVLCDVSLPGLDGFGLLASLREDPRTAGVPVVFLGENKNVEQKVRALEAGAVDYLSKPIYIKEIVARIRIHLQTSERRRLLETPSSEREGSLGDMGLIDLLHTLVGQTGLVSCVGLRGESALVWVRNGQVVDAQVGRAEGEGAFYKLLTWPDGLWRYRQGETERTARITRPLGDLLVDGLAHVDAWQRELERLAGLDAVYEVDFKALSDRLASVPDEVNAVLRLLDGRRGVRQVVEDSVFDGPTTLAVLNRLVVERFIRLVPALPHASPVLQALESWVSPASMLSDARLEPSTPDEATPAETLVREEEELVEESVATEPESDSGTVAEASGTVDEASGTVDGESGTLDEESGTLDEASGTLDEASGTVEEESGTVEEESGTVAREPVWDPGLEAASLSSEEFDIATEGEANLWAAQSDDDEAQPSLPSLFDAPEQDAMPEAAWKDESGPIPVMRYPSRLGARRERLEREAVEATAAVAAMGDAPVTLVDEVSSPGERPSEALVTEVEAAADVTEPEIRALDVLPEEKPIGRTSTTPAQAAGDDDDLDDDLALAFGKKSRAPVAVVIAIVAVVGVGALFALASGGKDEEAKPSVVKVEKPEETPVATNAVPLPEDDEEAPEAKIDDAEVAEPVEPEPVAPEPVAPEPVKPAPVEPEPVKPAPVEPAAVKPEPTPAEQIAALSEQILAASRRENWTQVTSLARRALKIDANHVVALRELGKAQYNSNKLSDARASLVHATRAGPRDAESFMYLGIVCQELDRTDEAINAYERFLELEPKSSSRYRDIGAVLANMKR